MALLRTLSDLKSVNAGTELWHVNPFGYGEKAIDSLKPKVIFPIAVSQFAFYADKRGELQITDYFSDLIGYSKSGIKKTFTTKKEADDYCDQIKKNGQFKEVINHHDSVKQMTHGDLL